VSVHWTGPRESAQWINCVHGGIKAWEDIDHISFWALFILGGLLWLGFICLLQVSLKSYGR
jgi:hypothetical protein